MLLSVGDKLDYYGDDIRRLTELRMIRNTQGPLVGR
jgi:hypothetical protein